MNRDLDGLLAFLDARARMPFAFGKRRNDCASFIAGAVKAQTGRDPFRGISWTSERGARRVAAREGGLVAAMDARFARIAPAMAQRGDIAGVEDPGFGARLMIVEGETLAGPGTRGMERNPRAAMTLAWSAVRAPAADGPDGEFADG